MFENEGTTVTIFNEEVIHLLEVQVGMPNIGREDHRGRNQPFSTKSTHRLDYNSFLTPAS